MLIHTPIIRSIKTLKHPTFYLLALSSVGFHQYDMEFPAYCHSYTLHWKRNSAEKIVASFHPSLILPVNCPKSSVKRRREELSRNYFISKMDYAGLSDKVAFSNFMQSPVNLTYPSKSWNRSIIFWERIGTRVVHRLTPNW